MIKKQVNFARPIFIIVLLIGIVIFATVAKAMGQVFVPITIALLISLVFQPIITMLHKRFKIPWIVGIILTITIVSVGVWAITSLLIASLKTIVEVYPKYEERFTIIYKNLADVFKLPYDANNTLFQNLWGQLKVRQTLQSYAFLASNSLFGFLKDLLLVIIVVIFFLLDLQYFQQKIELALGETTKSKAIIMITDIIKQVTKYISVKFYISLLTGILVFFGTLIIKLDFPIVWGFIAFVLNFIPTFGSIISGLLTTIFALAQFWPSPAQVFATGILMLGVNMVLGNIVEPRIQGRQLGLSPFIIIISLSFWGWLWDFTGLILAVPMMVIVKIICENFSMLQPIAVLMGNYSSEVKIAEANEEENTLSDLSKKTE